MGVQAFYCLVLGIVFFNKPVTTKKDHLQAIYRGKYGFKAF